MVEIEEGCLSFPDEYHSIERPETVKVEYQDYLGNKSVKTLEGMDCRVWLHEYDHMVGRDFTSRVSKMVFDRAIKKRDKLIKKMVREGKLQPPPKSV